MIKHLKPRSKSRVIYLRIKDYIIKIFKRKPKGIRGSYGDLGRAGIQGTVGSQSFRHSRRSKEYFVPLNVPLKQYSIDWRKSYYHVNKTP